MGGDFSEQNTGDFFVRLKPFPRRDIDEVMSEVRREINRSVPGFTKIELSQLMEDIIGDITGRPEPVVINLFSDDEKLLQDLAPRIADALEKVSGIADIDNGIVSAGDSVQVEIDR